MVDYVVRLDSALSPNTTTLPLTVVQDPVITEFVPESFSLSAVDNRSIILSFLVSTNIFLKGTNCFKK